MDTQKPISFGCSEEKETLFTKSFKQRKGNSFIQISVKFAFLPQLTPTVVVSFENLFPMNGQTEEVKK